MFTERGFSTITAAGMAKLNEFWGTIMPYYFQLIDKSNAVDRLEEAGFGEFYDTPYGGYIQRMSIDVIKPVTPAYRNLQNGKGPDPFSVHKPVVKERFFTYNFDYQSYITMPDEWQNKRIFISEYGISEFLAEVFNRLEQSFIVQKYTNKLEVLNAALNATEPGKALLPSQRVQIAYGDVPTEQEIIDFIMAIKDIVAVMDATPQTAAFNAYGYTTHQDISRLKLLTRIGFKNRVDLIAARNSFNRDTLNLPVDVIEVPNFGGLIPYKEAELTTRLYPVYDEDGAEIGFSEQQGQIGTDNVTVQYDEVFYKDPNESTIATLADQGFLFGVRKNPYTVEPIRNPRGLYTTYWASCPDNAILFDPAHTFVEFRKAA